MANRDAELKRVAAVEARKATLAKMEADAAAAQAKIAAAKIAAAEAEAKAEAEAAAVKVKAVEAEAAKVEAAKTVKSPPKRRGRPKGSKNKTK